MAGQLIPCVTKNSKGEWMQLICNEYSPSRQVHCDKYSSVRTGKPVQGFVNHMRTLHDIHLLDHFEAADRYGVPLDLNDEEKQSYEKNACKSKEEKQAMANDCMQSERQLRGRGTRRPASLVAVDEPHPKRKKKSVATSSEQMSGGKTAAHYPAEPAAAPTPLCSTNNAGSSAPVQSMMRDNAPTTGLPSLERFLDRRGTIVPLQAMIDEHEHGNRVMRRHLASSNAPDFIVPGSGQRAVVTSTGHVRAPAQLSSDRSAGSATRTEDLQEPHYASRAPTDPSNRSLAQRKPSSVHNGSRRQATYPVQNILGFLPVRMPGMAINDHQASEILQSQPSSFYHGYGHQASYPQANLQLGLAVQMPGFPSHTLHPSSQAMNPSQWGPSTVNDGYHYFTQDQFMASQAQRMSHGAVHGLRYQPPPAPQYGAPVVYGGQYHGSPDAHASFRFPSSMQLPQDSSQGVSIMDTITNPGAFIQSLSESAAQSSNSALNQHSTANTNGVMPTPSVSVQQSSSGQGTGQADFGSTNSDFSGVTDFNGFPDPMESNAGQMDDTQIEEQWDGMSEEFDADAFVNFGNGHLFDTTPSAGPDEGEVDDAALEWPE